MDNKIKGVIFDLDGTLIDSMGLWNKIDYDFLSKRGLDTPDNLSETVKSMSSKETAMYFKTRFSLNDSVDELISEWNNMAFYEYAHNLQLKPGAAEFLKKLKNENIKMCIATATYKQLVNVVLKNNNIYQYFDSISTLDEVNKNKSYPDIFLLSAKKLNLMPEQCVVFEDTLAAVFGAKKAGMKVIGVYDKYSESNMLNIQKNADKYIYDFYEMTKDK